MNLQNAKGDKEARFDSSHVVSQPDSEKISH